MAALVDLFSVRGKTVLVTGGSRGIGRMITEAFVEAGAKVVFITSRRFDACEKAAAEISREYKGRCVALPAADLAKGEAVCLDVSKSLRQEGVTALDVLVNNSGASWGEAVEKYQEKGWDKVMDVNVKGVFFLTKSLLPFLEKAATRGNPARVINVGSIAGVRPQSIPTFAYDASKAAVHHLTRHLAAFLASKNIAVNAIAPGVVPSKMSKGIKAWKSDESILGSIPLGRVGCKDDMAGVCLFLASQASSWMTGTVIPVDGGSLISSRL